MNLHNFSKKAYNIIKNKAINGSRYILVNYFSKFLNSYLLAEYPKSGGSWLGQLISSYLNIPFPRNRFPVLKQSLIHGHFLPKKNFKNFKKIFFMIRDGRDLIVSSYYYYFFFLQNKDKYNKDVYYLKKNLKYENYEDIKKNLPSYIEFMFTQKPPKLIRFSYEGNWRDYNIQWLKYYNNILTNMIIVKYEDLLKDTEKEFINILKETIDSKINIPKVREIVDKFSFAKQTKRKPGVEHPKSFLRKGISGDWKNKFTKESAEIFNYHAGDLLISLGYEKDRKWIDSLEE